jgi:hypothetical protein
MANLEDGAPVSALNAHQPTSTESLKNFLGFVLVVFFDFLVIWGLAIVVLAVL